MTSSRAEAEQIGEAYQRRLTRDQRTGRRRRLRAAGADRAASPGRAGAARRSPARGAARPARLRPGVRLRGVPAPGVPLPGAAALRGDGGRRGQGAAAGGRALPVRRGQGRAPRRVGEARAGAAGRLTTPFGGQDSPRRRAALVRLGRRVPRGDERGRVRRRPDQPAVHQRHRRRHAQRGQGAAARASFRCWAGPPTSPTTSSPWRTNSAAAARPPAWCCRAQVPQRPIRAAAAGPELLSRRPPSAVWLPDGAASLDAANVRVAAVVLGGGEVVVRSENWWEPFADSVGS